MRDKAPIPIIKSTEQENIEWNIAKSEERPFVVIVKTGKYCALKYDMFPVRFNLRRVGIEKLRSVFEEFIREQRDRPKTERALTLVFQYVIGSENGLFPFKQLNDSSSGFAEKVRMIVSDPENWVSID